MRLLQLNLDGNDDGVLDLHPMFSVVSGLTPSARARLVEAFTALPRAGDPGCAGLVEAAGIMLDLSAQTLALLGFDERELDVLVTGADIPVPTGPSGNGDGGPSVPIAEGGDLAEVVPFERRSGATRTAEVTPEWVIAEVAEGRFAELDAARAALASATEAQAVFDEATERARADYSAAMTEKMRLEGELARATQVLETARAGRAVEVEVDGDAADEIQPAADSGPDHAAQLAQHERDVAILQDRIDGLEERLGQIDRSLSELAAIDVKPIEVLLEAINNPAPTVMMPSERANELADEIVDLRRQLSEVEQRLDAEGFSIAKAESELEQARADLVSAERAMSKPRLSPDDIAELEAVHEKVLEAESKAGGRLGGRSGRKKLEEALNEQQAILDRVGFPTWSAYVMGAGLLGIDPVAEQHLEQAKAAVEQAEANWAVITETLETDPEYRGLLDRLEAVYLESFDLLGGDNEEDDLETSLRHLEVPVQEVTTEDLVAAMAYQFELLGLDLGADPQLEVVVMAAEALLGEAAAIQGRITELRDERVTVRRELSIAEQDLRHLPPPPEEPEPVAPAPVDERPAATTTEVVVDEAAVAEAEAQVAEATERLAAAEEDESDNRDLVDARVALADAARLSVLNAEQKLASVAADVAREHADELGGGPPVEPDLAEDAVMSGGIEILEDPGAPDLDSAPLDAGTGTSTGDAPGANRFLDILNDLPYGADAEDELEVPPVDEDDALSEVEFYLLARMAAQRSLSFAGSVPLLVDDALVGLAAADRVRMLERLEHMADAVQVVYLSDDPVVRGWADDVGVARAAVVEAPAGLD